MPHIRSKRACVGRMPLYNATMHTAYIVQAHLAHGPQEVHHSVQLLVKTLQLLVAVVVHAARRAQRRLELGAHAVSAHEGLRVDVDAGRGGRGRQVGLSQRVLSNACWGREGTTWRAARRLSPMRGCRGCSSADGLLAPAACLATALSAALPPCPPAPATAANSTAAPFLPAHPHPHHHHPSYGRTWILVAAAPCTSRSSLCRAARSAAAAERSAASSGPARTR